jgi:hypothetical protein
MRELTGPRLAATPSHHNRAGKKVKSERRPVFSDDEESDHENGDRDKHPDADFEV